MKFKIIKCSIRLAMFTLLIVASNNSISQENYSVENRTWDVCIKTSFPETDTICNYVWSYTFNSHGSFIESLKRTEHSVEIKNTKWKLEGKNLIFTTKQNDEIVGVKKISLIWTDDSNFHTVDKNSNGELVYTYYHVSDEE